MKNKDFVGFTKNHTYCVNVKEIEAGINTEFSYLVEEKNLNRVIEEHISKIPEFYDFYIYVKVFTENEDGGFNTEDTTVTVTFKIRDDVSHLPKPFAMEREEGIFNIEVVEELTIICTLFRVVTSKLEFGTKMRECLDQMIKENGLKSFDTTTIVNVLFASFKEETGKFEVYPTKVAITFQSKQSISNSNTELLLSDGLLKFSDFVDEVSGKDLLFGEKNKFIKKW